MEVKNNPAGRLYDLLKAAKKQPPREKVRDVWAKVFDVDPADTALLLTMIADLIILVANTKASIERLENVDNTLYLKPFVKLENLFSQVNLNREC
ncbi:hypothetical protein IMCC21906_00472 [Spongiibacter sp. IMCC21906]|uniref:hypothetical protein n=1 Tax=Spongiibacter sp. IMCC21906 TaxID=1620392 RepID=UPI00062DE8E9|nr:hypothetical protein [Spongiibacter sp. IMCC21906]AKH68165.1 hypothetical protein IMCC21906_00472 [Spongiibacter sp. IMCC21906]